MPKKIIPKPVYWTDFEDLCKRLWSEVWNYPETKKNGRAGQEQFGVDIYGRPDKNGGYIGIQCKGKDDYSHKQLTKEEIDIEIKKARLFKPALNKFYFATTANRASKIDEYIREKDEENRKLSLFEIHVFYWEDIADLIEQHHETYNWYINQIGFKNKTEATLKFDSGAEEISLKPIFIEQTTRYLSLELLKMTDYRESVKQLKILGGPIMPQVNKIKSFDDYIEFLNTDLPANYDTADNPQPVDYFLTNFVMEAKRKNLSVSTIRLKLVNVGSTVLENFKIYLSFDNLISCDTVNKNTKFLDLNKYTYNVKFHSGERIKAEYVPNETVLVQGDELKLDAICFKSVAEPVIATINWKLVARGYQNSGQLRMNIKPVKEKAENAKWVVNPKEYTNYKNVRNKYQY